MAFRVSRFNTYEKNFVNCRVLWKIENFSLAICMPDKIVTSKEFKVSGPKVTKWTMGFALESENQNLLMLLQRLDDDIEETMKVEWKITILDGKGEGRFISEKVSNFSQSSFDFVHVSTPLDILRVLSADDPNEVRIVYEMIVYMNKAVRMPSPNEVGLNDLITNLEHIHETCHLSDITAKLNGENLKLHKAILCPRSEKLARYAGCKRKKVFQLYYSDVWAIKKVFSYLYTGNLKYIFNPPSISINDYVRDLDIKELQNCYSQERITMETVVEANRFEFRWTIPEFCNCDEPQDSEVYDADGMRTRWQLRIYPKGLPEDIDRRTKYVYIEALVVNNVDIQDVYVDFKAKNKDCRTVVAKRMHGRVGHGKKFGVYFMRIGGYALTKALTSNTLDIHFSVSEATGKIDFRVIETQAPIPFNLTNHDTFKILTDYLGILQINHEYSDITLNVENYEFKSHKFLLAGRSIVFSSMLEGIAEENASLTINNVNRHVFRVFLDFLYRGTVTDVDLYVLMQVHDQAVKYKVKSLKTLCLRYLEGQLSPLSVCQIISFADARYLTKLKTNGLNFFFQFRDDMYKTDDWRDLERKNPRLACDIQIFVNINIKRLAEEVRQTILEVPEEETEVQEVSNPPESSTSLDQHPEGLSAVDMVTESRPDDSSEC